MSEATFLLVLHKTFLDIAVDCGDGNGEMMQSPGVEGVQCLLVSQVAECFGSAAILEKASLEAVRSFFEAQGWTEDHSFSWADLSNMIQCFKLRVTDNALPPPSGAEVDDDVEEVKDGSMVEACALASLVNTISERIKAEEFPLVRPSELESIEEQEAAALTLGLVEKIEMVKLESFLAESRRVYFQDEPLVLGVTHDEKVAQWSLHFHYNHMRDFIAFEALSTRIFQHRCQLGNFLPMIPPQTLQDPSKKAAALASLEKMMPTYLQSVNLNLWAAWAKMELVLEVTGEDSMEAFQTFLAEDYFFIISETCDDLQKKVASFVPPVAPEYKATEEVKVQRVALMERASLDDHTAVEAQIKEMYETFHDACDERQQRRLPEMPPLHFTAKHYYELLHQQVTKSSKQMEARKSSPEKTTLSGSSSSNDNMRDLHASRQRAQSPIATCRRRWALGIFEETTERAIPLTGGVIEEVSGLDQILAGNGFSMVAEDVVEREVAFMASLEIWRLLMRI